jgi:hypothetical protein
MAQVALAWLRHQNGASNPDYWCAKGISTPRQSRQFGSGTFRRTIEIPRWSKPNRTRIPPGYFTTEKRFVQLGMAACGIACWPKCGDSNWGCGHPKLSQNRGSLHLIRKITNGWSRRREIF